MVYHVYDGVLVSNTAPRAFCEYSLKKTIYISVGAKIH